MPMCRGLMRTILKSLKDTLADFQQRVIQRMNNLALRNESPQQQLHIASIKIARQTPHQAVRQTPPVPAIG
jgi:hypothetical protein